MRGGYGIIRREKEIKKVDHIKCELRICLKTLILCSCSSFIDKLWFQIKISVLIKAKRKMLFLIVGHLAFTMNSR